jgi:hypothetical protein
MNGGPLVFIYVFRNSLSAPRRICDIFREGRFTANKTVVRMNKIYLLAAPGLACAAACIPMAVSVPTAAAEATDEATLKILAARVRQQGFDCAKGKSANRDQKQSSPNETVWVLNCDNRRYRIRLVPDMGAKIEQLKQ